MDTTTTPAATAPSPEEKLAAVREGLAVLAPKLAEFIELASQPVDAGFRADAAYAKRAYALAGKLAGQDYFSEAEETKVAEALIADPSAALDLVATIADQAKVASADLGGATDLVKTAGSAPTVNALVKLAYEGAGLAVPVASSNMVD